KCSYKITKVECLGGTRADPKLSTSLVPDPVSRNCNTGPKQYWPNGGAPPEGCYLSVKYQGTDDCTATLLSSATGAEPYKEEGSTGKDVKLQTLAKFGDKLFVKCAGTADKGSCGFAVVQVECPAKK